MGDNGIEVRAGFTGTLGYPTSSSEYVPMDSRRDTFSSTNTCSSSNLEELASRTLSFSSTENGRLTKGPDPSFVSIDPPRTTSIPQSVPQQGNRFSSSRRDSFSTSLSQSNSFTNAAVASKSNSSLLAVTAGTPPATSHAQIVASTASSTKGSKHSSQASVASSTSIAGGVASKEEADRRRAHSFGSWGSVGKSIVNKFRQTVHDNLLATDEFRQRSGSTGSGRSTPARKISSSYYRNPASTSSNNSGEYLNEDFVELPGPGSFQEGGTALDHHLRPRAGSYGSSYLNMQPARLMPRIAEAGASSSPSYPAHFTHSTLSRLSSQSEGSTKLEPIPAGSPDDYHYVLMDSTRNTQHKGKSPPRAPKPVPATSAGISQTGSNSKVHFTNANPKSGRFKGEHLRLDMPAVVEDSDYVPMIFPAHTVLKAPTSAGPILTRTDSTREVASKAEQTQLFKAERLDQGSTSPPATPLAIDAADGQTPQPTEAPPEEPSDYVYMTHAAKPQNHHLHNLEPASEAPRLSPQPKPYSPLAKHKERQLEPLAEHDQITFPYNPYNSAGFGDETGGPRRSPLVVNCPLPSGRSSDPNSPVPAAKSPFFGRTDVAHFSPNAESPSVLAKIQNVLKAPFLPAGRIHRKRSDGDACTATIPSGNLARRNTGSSRSLDSSNKPPDGLGGPGSRHSWSVSAANSRPSLKANSASSIASLTTAQGVQRLSQQSVPLVRTGHSSGSVGSSPANPSGAAPVCRIDPTKVTSSSSGSLEYADLALHQPNVSPGVSVAQLLHGHSGGHPGPPHGVAPLNGGTLAIPGIPGSGTPARSVSVPNRPEGINYAEIVK